MAYILQAHACKVSSQIDFTEYKIYQPSIVLIINEL